MRRRIAVPPLEAETSLADLLEYGITGTLVVVVLVALWEVSALYFGWRG